jgi:magnesium transporter
MNQPQPIALLLPEIKELLASKDYTLLKQVINECNALDFADTWKRFTEEERLQIFRLLPSRAAFRLFEILDIEDQRALLARLSEENVAPILEGIDSPDLAKIFHKMSPRSVKKMTSLIKRQEALAHIDYLMKFPEHTVGSHMHPEFVRLKPRMTAKQALSLLQAIARPNQKEHLYSLYVVDEEGRAIGSLSLQDLISAPEDEPLADIMTPVAGIRLKPEMDQEDAAKLFSKYDLSSAPVVDNDDRLIGILTVKDIVSVIRHEATEDIAKMAGTRATELQEKSVFRIVAIRMPWLIVTLIGGTFISIIIRSFEPILAKVIALASFSPLIAGMGGNVGSQSATVIVRSMALGKWNRQQKVKTIFREMGVGFSLGCLYGTVLAMIAYVFYGHLYGIHLSIVVASAMCTAMTVAATMGALGPMLFERIGIDPATAAGPIVSTTTDIFSNFIYFGMATLLLWRY